MNFTEAIKLALSSIWAHKLRSFLTLLGMIISVAAFMLVLSALLGFNSYIDEKIAGVGSNSFTVRRFDFSDFKDTDTLHAAQRRNKDLTYQELDFIRERADLVKELGAKSRGSRAEVKRGSNKLEDIQVDGVEPITAQIDNIEVESGRFFTSAENQNSARVAFVGKDVADELFPTRPAIGGEMYIRGIPYRIVGVQVAKGTVFGMPQDNFVTLPIKTYSSQFGPPIQSRGLYFVGTSYSDKTFDDAVEQVRSLLRIKRKIPYGEKDNFGISTPDAIAGIRDRIFGTVFTVILIVPAIALLVGAIVIMNIMLVAVTERTKEIGIRKSLGARQNDILAQFLYESALLAAIGGFIGLIVAELLGIVVSQFAFPTVIPWYAALIAIVVCALVGIVAGLFPAWKAARLDPIEALRSD